MSEVAESVADKSKVIIQISDTHIAAEGNLHEFVDSLDNLSSILAFVESAGAPPDLLLFTGDLADKGEPAAYRRFRSTVEPFAARMGVPTLYLPGNHDTREAFRAHLLDWEENEEVIDQVCWLGGLRVIALDSTVPGAAHGEIDEGQLEWLRAELEVRAPLGTILALHHPPVPGPSAFLNGIVLREPQRLGEVLAGSDVAMIVSGHAHHASAGAIAGIPVWVATATAYQIDVFAAATTSLRGLPGSAFTRLDVTADGAVATHIPMLPPQRVVYDVDFATLRRFIEQGGASHEEIEAAFAPVAAGS